MASNFLFSAWKVIHAKFVKPVDKALDSFSMLMLQWVLGTYNIWDVLQIMFNVCVSAVVYVAYVIRNPSILWTKVVQAEDVELDPGACDEANPEIEKDDDDKEGGDIESIDQKTDPEDLSVEASETAHQHRQRVTLEEAMAAPAVRHRVQSTDAA
ncbi:hypothetical protein BOX15_Mlig023129g2 [Macrostomum lignano]|uniref:Uncharacterized protein n=1 Tax=Macrostomum lignano TaxID=282301 RepID=A0A267E6Z7_9PLAT|nr:hypothetical protein BOX15_Mlig023129g2 [Macrostomum lignano]